MDHYEILYIIPSKYEETDLSTVDKKISALIEKEGGKITSKDDLGRRKLAHPIKNVRQGFYLKSEFDFPAQKLTNLNNSLKLMPEVLRHIIITAGIRILKGKRRERLIDKKVKEMVPKITADLKEKATKEEKKITMKELDEKLDQILEDDIMK